MWSKCRIYTRGFHKIMTVSNSKEVECPDVEEMKGLEVISGDELASVSCFTEVANMKNKKMSVQVTEVIIWLKSKTKQINTAIDIAKNNNNQNVRNIFKSHIIETLSFAVACIFTDLLSSPLQTSLDLLLYNNLGFPNTFAQYCT